jgi:hypothetical protein
MSNIPSQTARQITDTQRLDFLEQHSVKLESPNRFNTDFTVALFGEKSVQVFLKPSAREAIDAAMQSAGPARDPQREFQEYLQQNLKVGQRRETADGMSGSEVWDGERWVFDSRPYR